MAPPKRRRSDTTSLVVGAAKATAAFMFFGALSFIGTWAVGISGSMAKLEQDVAVIHERQEFLAPWLVEEIKALRSDLKELRKEVKGVR